MRLNYWPALLVFTLLCLGGCGDSGTGKKPAPPSEGTAVEPGATPAPAAAAPVGNGRTQIGFVVRGDDGYWKAVHAGAEKAVQEGHKGPGGRPVLDILWVPAKAEGQVGAAKDLLGKGVAALVIASDDAATLTAIVSAAGRVPVVAINVTSNITGAVNGVRSIIGTEDNEEDVATRMAKTKPKNFAFHHGGGMGKDDMAELKAGKMDAVFVMDPMEIGALAVKTASDCVREKKVEKRIDVPWHIVTRENMDSPENAALLNPPVEKYLKP